MTKDNTDTGAEINSYDTNEPIPFISRECVHQMLRTQVAFRRALQRSVKRHNYGITFEMFQILSILWYEEGVSQQELARRTAKNKASLTSLMSNLEKRGYVRREEATNDRRNKLVYLTESGSALKGKVMPGVYEVYNSIQKELGEEQLKEMLEFLHTMEKSLKNY